MQLYQTPAGTWCGTQADWAKAMKAEGHDPKTYTGRRAVTVPTDKKGLLEFLTFHRVNVLNPLQAGEAPISDAAPLALPPMGSGTIEPATTVPFNLADAFAAAPIKVQAELAVAFIDRLTG